MLFVTSIFQGFSKKRPSTSNISYLHSTFWSNTKFPKQENTNGTQFLVSSKFQSSNHWSFACVDLGTSNFYVADSLNSHQTAQTMDRLLVYTQQQYNMKENSQTVRQIPCLMQPDSHNCGIYLMEMLITFLAIASTTKFDNTTLKEKLSKKLSKSQY